MDKAVLILNPEDNVAVALRDLRAGESVGFDGGVIVVAAYVPQGHKIARRDLSVGDEIIKYGMPVGRAARSIAVGEHVHVHNVTSIYMDNEEDHCQ